MSGPVVIKLGGALLGTDLSAFWEAVVSLSATREVILVHGGGAQATALARRLGHEPRIVQGRRVTTDTDLDIVKWTMRGAVNTDLVAAARTAGLAAVGVSGVDGGILQVDRRPPWEVDGESVDFGWVGDVRAVDPGLLHALLAAGYLPVVAPLGVDKEGRVYNVNADTVARSVAVAVGAAELLLVTPSGSLRRSADGTGEPVLSCDRKLFEAGIADGWIAGGMRVKLQVAFDALEAGVLSVSIVSPDDLVLRQGATRVLP